MNPNKFQNILCLHTPQNGAILILFRKLFQSFNLKMMLIDRNIFNGGKNAPQFLQCLLEFIISLHPYVLRLNFL